MKGIHSNYRIIEGQIILQAFSNNILRCREGWGGGGRQPPFLEFDNKGSFVFNIPPLSPDETQNKKIYN